jgi:isoleucyl-tRNA synthetase
MDVVEQIRWIPEFGYAREMDWLRNMHDWMISKEALLGSGAANLGMRRLQSF